MQNSFYSQKELSELGLKQYGKNVLLSRYARIYSPEQLILGNNVRIDDYCLLSGNIVIGDNVHISAYCALYGSNGIEFHDNSGCSARTTIYSAIDDFSGEYLIGPLHPREYTNVTGGKVSVGPFAQIGAHCLIFPNLQIREGAVIGACSFVKKDVDEWTINVGTPAKFLKYRSRRCKIILQNTL